MSDSVISTLCKDPEMRMFLEADNNPKGIRRQYECNFTISLKLETKILGITLTCTFKT